MRIKLQPYELDMKYKPGKLPHIADALSRSCKTERHMEMIRDELDDKIEAHVSMIIHDTPISNEKFEEFKKRTDEDEELQTVIKLIEEGWPKNKNDVPIIALPYHNFEHELTAVEGLLFKNESIVVPKLMRKGILDKIHYNHLGISKCKSRARNSVYWPQMNKEIEDRVTTCNTCQKYQKRNIKQPMIAREIPYGPWQEVGTDIFYYKGKDFLIVVDAYSKFMDVEKLQDMAGLSTIKAMKKIFSRYGIPRMVYSDNGPQYSNRHFRKFAKDWGFVHRTSSPQYPQSNGLAERYVQTIKQLWKKAEFDNKDPYLAILEYGTTPISDQLSSPVEMMFGRKLEGILPHREQLIGKPINNLQRQKLQEEKDRQKRFYDRGAKSLKSMKVDEDVYVCTDTNKNTLTEAKIVKQNERPRSYQLMTKYGTIIDRNRRDMYQRTSSQPFQIQDRQWEEIVKEGTTPNEDGGIQKMSTDAGEVMKVLTKAKSPVTSKSGRVLKAPSYLKDYIT